MTLVNLFIADGRLGNQLFQLNWIRSSGLTNIWISGYRESVGVFSTESLERVRRVNHRFAKVLGSQTFKSLICSIKPALRVVGVDVISGRGMSTEEQLRQISSMKDTNTGKKGLRIMVYMDLTMLGADSYQKSIMSHKEEYISRGYRSAALTWFKERELKPEDCCFVHVRKGDYRSWPSAEVNAILPIGYYRDAIKLIREWVGRDSLRILVSSDENISLDRYNGNYLVHEGAELTFAILSMCRHGVLSPSTFSLAAAFHNYEAKREGMFIAPLYWGGYKADEWYPDKNTMSFSEITYINKEGNVDSCLRS